jgi:LysM repeat protein
VDEPDDDDDPHDEIDDEPGPTIPQPPITPTRRPIPRTNPVVLDRGRSAPQMRFPGSRQRTPGGSGGFNLPPVLRGRGVQAGLAGVVVIALVAVLFVRLSSSDKPGASPSASARPSSSIAATLRPSAIPPTDAPSIEPTTSAPLVTAAATPKPTKTATPKTYKVKAGDTLTSIAAKFGTTAAILQKLNNIKDPKLLQIGTILKLP